MEVAVQIVAQFREDYEAPSLVLGICPVLDIQTQEKRKKRPRKISVKRCLVFHLLL